MRDTDIEKCMFEALQEKLDRDKAVRIITAYNEARLYLFDSIYGEIKASENNLTDHSDRHVLNVLDNVWALIGRTEGAKFFNCIELYLLCLAVLYHDVGNILGRENHNTKVAEVYNASRGNKIQSFIQERGLLLRIVRAHCGKNRDGDRDTLRDVDISSNLYEHNIRTREIASILRFADELAEGIQRISMFRLDNGLIDENSFIYHKYASVTSVFIDRGNERIALTYNIEYPDDIFDDLMNFIYSRILKLDEERRFCKYYSNILAPIKKTEVTFSFTVHGDICDLDVPKIELGDKYRLGQDDVQTLLIKHPNLDVENVKKQLKTYL